MKNLNKKGFTLVELLAVIVILAVIMVITIPTVLSSMGTATDSAAQSAIAAVQKYIDDQTTLCQAGLGDVGPSMTLSFDNSCGLTSDAETILKKAGYSKEFSGITFKKETVYEGPCYAVPADGVPTGGKQTNCEYTKVDGTKANDGYQMGVEKNTNKIESVNVAENGQFKGDASGKITFKANN